MSKTTKTSLKIPRDILYSLQDILRSQRTRKYVTNTYKNIQIRNAIDRCDRLTKKGSAIQ